MDVRNVAIAVSRTQQRQRPGDTHHSAAPDRSAHGRFGSPGRPRAQACVRDGPVAFPGELTRRHAARPPGTAACAAARRAGRFWRDAREAICRRRAGGRGGLTTAAGRGGWASSSCATRRGINALWCDAGGRLRRRVAWGCEADPPDRRPLAGARETPGAAMPACGGG